MFSRLYDYILMQRDRVVEIQTALCSFPAISPFNGGKGELVKARWIERMLENAGIPFQRSDSGDPCAEGAIRPNIIARLKGNSSQTLWLFAHMDVVSPGALEAWKSDPWTVCEKGDLLYGRGVEDNQQAIASMLVLAESLQHCGLLPELSLGLVFMSDEECGSTHGMKWLLKNNRALFSPDDLYIVPDGGSPSGADIEIAEKAQLWLKFLVTGKQAHASMPGLGKNAFVAASQLVLVLQSLYKIFPQTNSLFDPPFSTFVPTRHEENVDAINILPGKDIFYLDCRLLPEVPETLVMEQTRSICDQIARQSGVGIEVEIINQQPATAISMSSPVVESLERAILRVYGVKARPVGIGGATVAANLRQANLPAAVWSCILGTCHQPNEASSISATLRDAAVFGHILMEKGSVER